MTVDEAKGYGPWLVQAAAPKFGRGKTGEGLARLYQQEGQTKQYPSSNRRRPHEGNNRKHLDCLAS